MHHTLFETKDKTMFLTFTIKLLLLVFFYDSCFSTKKHITKHVFFRGTFHLWAGFSSQTLSSSSENKTDRIKK